MQRRITAIVASFGAAIACGMGCGSEEGAAPGVDAGLIPPPPVEDAGSDASSNPITCGDEELANCRVGRCTLTAARGALTGGAKVTLAQVALPPELAGDALGNVVCDVQIPNGVTVGFSLSIGLDAPAPATGTLFRYGPPDPPSVVTSTAKANAVEGIVTASGTFGVTDRPAPWRVEATIDPDPTTVIDMPTRVRNITSGTMFAAYYDGTHFFVGSGKRLLVYSGLPAGPATAPIAVLGQPSLDTDVAGTSSALFSAGISGIWSNGQKLVASNGNRVLVWNGVPTASFTPADLVLGQPDFSSTGSNTGGISASTLASARGIDSDGSRLVVADALNHRVLVWNAFPQTIAQPATLVIGQPTFATNDQLTPPASLLQPVGAALDGSGGAFVASLFTGTIHVPLGGNNPAPDAYVYTTDPQVRSDNAYNCTGVVRVGSYLAVGDSFGGRVAFRSSPVAGVGSMDFALGQPDTARGVVSPTSASSFQRGLAPNGPVALSNGGGAFMVADYYRVLVWETPPSYNFEPASRVVGQPGFTTNDPGIDYRRISASTLGYPSDVAMDATRVAIADRGNNRVLVHPIASLGTSNPAATVVLGQPDATSFVPNLDQRTPNASRMNGPGGVALAAGRLIVADTENHRVLIWNTVPSASGAAADLVLGQADFAGHRPNRGRGDGDADGFSDAAADGFFAPTGVASDGTRLFVADRLNNRVLVWDTFPTSNGQAASRVLGQATFTGVVSNRGNGGYSAVADGFNLPTGLVLSGSALWVADTENNRVVRIDDVNGTPAVGLTLGQTSSTALANPNYEPLASPARGMARAVATSSTSVIRPRGLALAGGRLYVGETSSNRVHVFDATSGASLAVLGQSTDSNATENAGGISASSLAKPMGLASDGTRLLVADSSNHRVVGWSVAAPPANGAAATLLVGQTSFVGNGFNQAIAASAGGGTRPRALARFGNQLYAVETNHHRVVVRDVPIAPGGAIKKIYGQPNDTLILPNAGGAPSAQSLSSPKGIFVTASRVLVADTGNNRVLAFDPNAAGADATLVLGQADFTGAAANRGGAAGAGTLSGPEAVYTDGTKLFVADTGNHRVLVWNALPTQNGQPADVVLGQASATAVLPNAGAAAPTAATMFSPVGLDVVKGALFVADSGNNRVLRFSTVPTASGVAATNVLGQGDLVSRVTTADAADKDHLAGPLALADDGTNLYVTDRDLGRVVVYGLPGAVTGASATNLLGAAGGALVRAPAGVVAERTPLFTSRVYVADTNGDRVLVLGSVSRLLGAN